MINLAEQEGMRTLADINRVLSEQAVKIEYSAVAEYVRLQIEHLLSQGKKLEDYYLVRENGNFRHDGDNAIKISVYYGLKHKDEVQ